MNHTCFFLLPAFAQITEPTERYIYHVGLKLHQNVTSLQVAAEAIFSIKFKGQMSPKWSAKHRRSQYFVWGALFFSKKSWRPFLVVTLKTHAKPTTSPTVQISPISSQKWTLALPRGVHSLPRGAQTTFPCKFGPDFLSVRPGGARAPRAPPGYAYVAKSNHVQS